MIQWVDLTRFGANRKLPVNVSQIAYVDQTLGGSMIYFGSGGSLRVTETVEEVKRLAGASLGAPVAPEQHTADIGAAEQPAAAAEPAAQHEPTPSEMIARQGTPSSSRARRR